MKLHKHLNNEEVVEWFNIPWLTECKKKEQGQKKKKEAVLSPTCFMKESDYHSVVGCNPVSDYIVVVVPSK